MAQAFVVDSSSPSPRRSYRGSVLGLGLGSESQRTFAQAADQAALIPSAEATLLSAEGWLENNRPLAIVVEGEVRQVEDVCYALRQRASIANVPIVAVVERVDELAFETIYGAGGDDVVLRSASDALGRRLRVFALAGDVPLSRKRGLAVVAHPDRRARMLCGRALRNAGFAVVFALDADEALARAREPGVELVVSAAELEEPTGPMLAARARAEGEKVAWVVMAAPRDVARTRARLAGIERAGAHDSYGPPENVLFVANELIRGGVSENRKSPRVLYGATVRFRPAGGDSDEIGYTFNLSAGGIYVRTLSPLPRGSDAWLEMDPPRSDRAVRLEGKVVWTRAFGPNDAATVPAGFGVQITGGSIPDLERFARGYRAFAGDVS